MTALPAAVRAHIPLVIFAGESPLRNSWYNQQLDQAPLVTACGAAYQPLHHPDRMRRHGRDGVSAVWDFHISDRILSPVMQRAPPQR